MAPKVFAQWVGLALIAVGLVLGLVPVSTSGSGAGATSVSCGPALFPMSDDTWTELDRASNRSMVYNGIRNMEDYGALCGDARGSRQPWVWVLIGLGVIVVAGGALIKVGKEEPKKADLPGAVFQPDDAEK